MEDQAPQFLLYSNSECTEVRVGSQTLGGRHPILVQSMANCSTLDTAMCLEQIERLYHAGCRVVRFTAQGIAEAANLRHIRAAADDARMPDMAITADIHFLAEAADTAADHADKVRVNPGNYPLKAGNFRVLIEKCRQRGVALRIGVNHGSLARHIVEKWGDTPEGMVESAMEFLCECRTAGFDQVVVSIKSSNVRVMVHAYRLLAARLACEGMNFPLHLGVTEAGDGAEGRIRSAVGIGTLLADGIGSTIRVSLTEPPENEIPAANILARYFDRPSKVPPTCGWNFYSPYQYQRRETEPAGNVGGGQLPVVMHELNGEAAAALAAGKIIVLDPDDTNSPVHWRSRILELSAQGDRRPVILHKTYDDIDLDTLRIKAGADFGPLFVDGLADGLWLESRDSAGEEVFTQEEIIDTALMILQAARVRTTRTEYIACPGCGRTLFDLQSTLRAVKERTSHLSHLKIAVMGCIVNGPGEMADADYGYVGAGPDKVNLYRNRCVIRKGIPQSEAVEALVECIRQNGDWIEPGPN